MNAVASVITSNGSGCADAVMSDAGCWTNNNVASGVDSSCILMLAVPEHVASTLATLVAVVNNNTAGGGGGAVDALSLQLQQAQVKITVYPAGTTSFPTSCLVFVAAPPSDTSRGGLSSREVVIQDWALSRQQVVSGAAAAQGLSLSVPLSSLFNVASLIGSPLRQPPPASPGAAAGPSYPLVFLGLRFVGCTDLSGQHRIRRIRVELHGTEKILSASAPLSAARGQLDYYQQQQQQQRAASATPFGNGTDRALSLSPREASVGVTSTVAGGATTPRKQMSGEDRFGGGAMTSRPPPASQLPPAFPSAAALSASVPPMAPQTRTHYESNVLLMQQRGNNGVGGAGNNGSRRGLLSSVPTSPDTSVIEVEVDRLVETPPLPIHEGGSASQLALQQQQQQHLQVPPPLPPSITQHYQQQHASPHMSPERPRTGSQLPHAAPFGYAIPSSPDDRPHQGSAVSPLPYAPVIANSRRPLNSASALDVDLSPLAGAPGSENAHSRVEAARSRIEHLTREQQQHHHQAAAELSRDDWQQFDEHAYAESGDAAPVPPAAVPTPRQDRSELLEASLAAAERRNEGYSHENFERERHMSEQRQHLRTIAHGFQQQQQQFSPPANHADSSFYGPNTNSKGPNSNGLEQNEHRGSGELQALNRIAFNSSQYYDAARTGRLNVAPSARFHGGSRPSPTVPPKEAHNFEDLTAASASATTTTMRHVAATTPPGKPHGGVRPPPVAPPSPRQPVVVKSPAIVYADEQQQQQQQQEYQPRGSVVQQMQSERDAQHSSAIERAHMALRSAEHARERSVSAGTPAASQQQQPQLRSTSLDELSGRIAPLTTGLREITSRLNNIMSQPTQHLPPSGAPSSTSPPRGRSSSAPPVLTASAVEPIFSASNNVSSIVNGSTHVLRPAVNTTIHRVPSFMQQHQRTLQEQQRSGLYASMLASGAAPPLAAGGAHFVPVSSSRRSASPPMPDFIPPTSLLAQPHAGGNAAAAAAVVPNFLRTMQPSSTPIPMHQPPPPLSSLGFLGGSNSINLSTSAWGSAGVAAGSNDPRHNATTSNPASFLLSRASGLDRTHNLLEEARSLVESSIGVAAPTRETHSQLETRNQSPARPMPPGSSNGGGIEPPRSAAQAAAQARSRQPPMAPRVVHPDDAEQQQQQQQQQQQPQNRFAPVGGFAGYREERMQRVGASMPQQQHVMMDDSISSSSTTQLRQVRFNENVATTEFQRQPPPPPRVHKLPQRSTTPPGSANSSFSGAGQQPPPPKENVRRQLPTGGPENRAPQQQQQDGLVSPRKLAGLQQRQEAAIPVYQRQMMEQQQHQQQQPQDSNSQRNPALPPPPPSQLWSAPRQPQLQPQNVPLQQVSVVDSSPTTWRQQPQPSPQHMLQPPRYGPSSPSLPDAVAEIAVPCFKHHVSRRQAGDFMLLLSRLSGNSAAAQQRGHVPGVFVELQPRAESELSPDTRAALRGGRGGSLDREGSVPRPSSSVVEWGKATLRTGQAALQDPALHKNCLHGDGSWALVLRLKGSAPSPLRGDGAGGAAFESLGPLVVACELKSRTDFKRVVEFLANLLNVVPMQ